MENRKVIVHYKKVPVFNNQTGEHDLVQRPSFETLESNIPAHEKLYGHLIKEIKLKESNAKLHVSNIGQTDSKINTKDQTEKIIFLEKENERLLAQNVNLTVKLQEKKSSVEFSTKTLVEYFIKKDKTPLSIAKYLNVTIEEVNKYLPETVNA